MTVILLGALPFSTRILRICCLSGLAVVAELFDVMMLGLRLFSLSGRPRGLLRVVVFTVVTSVYLVTYHHVVRTEWCPSAGQSRERVVPF